MQQDGCRSVVIHPIGFLSDHMEVLYDLDEEARRLADRLGLHMARSAAVGTHPEFVSMLAELVRERAQDGRERRASGRFGPQPDTCPPDCCASGRPATARPHRPHAAGQTPAR